MPWAGFRKRVHPRACGGNPNRADRMNRVPGPSPRVRGKRQRTRHVFVRCGSIPARAGETFVTCVTLMLSPVHPRACGGNESRGHQ